MAAGPAPVLGQERGRDARSYGTVSVGREGDDDCAASLDMNLLFFGSGGS